jgi:hypothetical protein
MLVLTKVPTAKCIELLTSFAEQVQDGHCINGNQVQAATVQVALCAIGKTYKMDGRPNPTYRSKGKYWLPIERLVEAQHKLAVPVSLVEYLMDLWKASTSKKVKAVCNMSTIAFYYLLRVSKYTGHRCKDQRRTKQFQACDITFYNCNHTIIQNTAPLAQLYMATKAAMRITNQKNGTRGSIISHNISLTKACPVRALEPRVHHIMSTAQCSATDIISTYYSPTTKHPCPLQSSDIKSMIKSVVRALNLDKRGFPPEAMSSHSLCTGGAMAMHLNNMTETNSRNRAAGPQKPS